MDNTTLPKTQQLIVFQEVIRSGSLGSAAKKLNLTQPAISKIISDMETYFGSELIFRKNTGVILTEAGKILLSYAESITRELKNLYSEIHQLAGNAVGDVSFGYPSLIGFTFLPDLIKEFKGLFPQVQLSMFEAQLSSFLPAIRDGRLDFAIGTLSDDMLLQDLHIELLFESEFILIANRTHPARGKTTLAALSHQPWVLPQTEMGYYSELLTTLQKNNIQREHIVKTDSIVTIYNLVLNADFITIIPRDMVAPFGSNQFVNIEVADALPVARYAAVWSKNYRINQPAAELVELARKYSYSRQLPCHPLIDVV
jgi:LysR family tdc operon transcriptional activator